MNYSGSLFDVMVVYKTGLFCKDSIYLIKFQVRTILVYTYNCVL